MYNMYRHIVKKLASVFRKEGMRMIPIWNYKGGGDWGGSAGCFVLVITIIIVIYFWSH
jgi:hypothetical protein